LVVEEERTATLVEEGVEEGIQGGVGDGMTKVQVQVVVVVPIIVVPVSQILPVITPDTGTSSSNNYNINIY